MKVIVEADGGSRGNPGPAGYGTVVWSADRAEVLAEAKESIGVATGYPFGQYHYTGTLGPAVLGVPVLVPLAWVMMAYPCLLAGRTVAAQVMAGSSSGSAARPRASRPTG